MSKELIYRNIRSLLTESARYSPNIGLVHPHSKANCGHNDRNFSFGPFFLNCSAVLGIQPWEKLKNNFENMQEIFEPFLFQVSLSLKVIDEMNIKSN